MEVRAQHQFAGVNPFSDLLNERLGAQEYDRLRVLVAFARWSGLHLIDEGLREFTARGSLDAIVGIDLGGTTAEALEYLMNLPNSTVRIVRTGNPRIIFHPKVFIFDGDDSWTAIVGSANATTGGLFTNAEVGVEITGTAQETNPLESVWNGFDQPEPPLEAAHVPRLNDELLDELAEDLDKYQDRPPDRGKTPPAEGVEPVGLVASPPAPGRPPRSDSEEEIPGESQEVPPSNVGETLYMEVWGETGGGTQVQFPKYVINNYFGASAGSYTWVTIESPLGQERQRIQVFDNNTFRIPLRLIADVARPAVVRFVRTGPDTYEVSSRHEDQGEYETWLSKCTEQTRPDSKRYGIE